MLEKIFDKLEVYLKKYEEDFSNCREYAKNIRTWYKLIPNMLTISRPLGMIPANILFFTGNTIPAVVLVGGLLFTDLFDGKLARKWGVESKLGADLDAVGDKIMFLGMAFPLFMNVPTIIVNFVLESLIAFVNVYGRMNDLDTKTVYSGKVKTCFLSFTLLMGYLVSFFNVPRLLFNISMLFTSFSQGYALSDYVSNYEEMKSAKQIDTVEDSKQVVANVNDKIVTSKIDELKREKEFYLGFSEIGKVYTGKKRVRKMMEEKRNSHI